MSLNLGSRTLAEIFSKQVNGTSGIGVQGLTFGLHLHLHAWKEPYVWMKNLRAKVSLVGNGNLGVANVEDSFMARNYDYATDQHSVLSLNLTREQIEELERIRSGGGLKFTLALSFEVFGSSEPCFVHEQITVEINQSQWLTILREMRYSDVLLYEVKQPMNSESRDPAYEDLHQSLRDAQRHFEIGQYNDAVADCRIALELTEKLFSYRAETKLAMAQFCSDNRKDREAMNKDQRMLIIKEALRHYTHLTHHPDGEGKIVSLSRSEAGAILGCVFSFIGKAAGEI